jgi:hypothetical protein
VTLTDILPSMRRVIADPFAADAWPAMTRPTVDDVVIGGVSLVRLASICETPCVHTGAALVPRSGGRVSAVDDATAIVVSVRTVSRHTSGAVVVQVDARLGAAPVVIRELRLIGRVSTVHDVAVVVGLDDEGPSVAVVDLPADLRVGDLLAVPCPGDVTVGRLRRRPSR